MADPESSAPVVVAVVNTNDDLVEVLRDALIREGFKVVTAHIRDIKAGHQDFQKFLQAHRPAVVVYDIAVPYEDNWTFLETLRRLPATRESRFVITTVNKRIFEQRVGRRPVLEIQGGRADDLDPVIEAVQAATKGVPRRGG